MINDEIDGFAITVSLPNAVYLAVDCAASVSLFYAVKDEDIFVSDDAKSIAEVGMFAVSSDNVEEFKALQVVSENGTLFEDVFCLKPGQTVLIDKGTGSIVIKDVFSFGYDRPCKMTLSEGIEEYDSVLKSVFSDLIKLADGRPIWVSLSGGLDSRTIAVMLKRLGYKNLHCFSYGRDDCFEGKIAENVSKGLECDFHYISYGDDVFNKIFARKGFNDLARFYSCGTNGFPVADIPAYDALIEQGLLTKDSMVVFGVAQDYFAGSYVRWLFGKGKVRKNQLIERLIRTEYVHKHDFINIQGIRKWSDQLPDVMNNREAMGFYENIVYTSYIVKFCAKMTRYEDLKEIGWNLPFCCRKNLEFWSKVPSELLFERNLQFEHAKKYIDPVAKTSRDKNDNLRMLYYNTDHSKGRDLSKYSAPVRSLAKDLCNQFYNMFVGVSDEEFQRCISEFGTGARFFNSYALRKVLSAYGIK